MQRSKNIDPAIKRANDCVHHLTHRLGAECVAVIAVGCGVHTVFGTPTFIADELTKLAADLREPDWLERAGGHHATVPD